MISPGLSSIFASQQAQRRSKNWLLFADNRRVQAAPPPPPPFVPSDLPGLVAWYDAEDGVNSTGGTVTSWLNKVAGGNDLTLVPVAPGPTVGDYFEGKRGVKIIGTDALNSVQGILPFDIGFGWAGPWYFFCVSSGAIVDGHKQSLLTNEVEVLSKSNYGELVTAALGSSGITYFIGSNYPVAPVLPADAFISVDGVGTDRTHPVRVSVRRGSTTPWLVTEDDTVASGNAAKDLWNVLSVGGNFDDTQDRTIHEIIVCNAALTTDQIASLKAYFVNRWFTPVKNFVLFVGDSLTTGYTLPITDSYPRQLITTFPTIDGFMASKVGITVQDTLALLPQYQRFYRPGKTNVAVVWAGANDVTGLARTAAQIYADIGTACTTLKNQGYKVIVMDITSFQPAFGSDVVRNAVNALLAGGHTFADGYVHLSADARIGTDSAWENPTYFVDTIHMTAAGYAVVTSLLTPVLQSLL